MDGPGAAAPAHEHASPVVARAVEQLRGFGAALCDRRGQAAVERRRQRQLAAGLDLERVGQAAAARRGARVRAQELVHRRQLGSHARGLAARGLDGPVGLAGSGPGRLGALA